MTPTANIDKPVDRAIQVYKRFLYSSVNDKTWGRFRQTVDLMKHLDKEGFKIDNYADLESFMQGKGLPITEKFKYQKLRGDIGSFVDLENFVSLVETPITSQMFSEESRLWFNNGFSEDDIYKLFKILEPGTRIGPYMLIGYTRIKKASWAGFGQIEVAIWRDVENPNALDA